MVAIAGSRGFAAASVSRIVETAGVSRATFYEHFSDRDECLLAAYEDLAGRVDAALGGLQAAAPEERLRCALTELLTAAERSPAAARLMTIEVVGAGPGVREARRRLHDRVEAAMRKELGGGKRVSQLPASGLIGGVENVIATRVFRGESNTLGRLLFDLIDWIDSYLHERNGLVIEDPRWDELARRMGTPGSVVLPEEVRLPRGRSALPAAAVEATQRDRILRAVAVLSRERGYLRTTVAEIVARAQISRQAFYNQFEGKRDAFKATQVAALQAVMSRSAEAFFGADNWPDRVWNGLEALLRHSAENPDLAYLDTVDSYAVGEEAIARSIENRMAFNLFLAEGYEMRRNGRRLPQLCSEAIGGAILELLRSQVLGPGAEHSLEALPQAAYVALAPFVGSEEAAAYVNGRVE